MDEIIEELNDKQKEAVLATDGPCLVIAGAGSNSISYERKRCKTLEYIGNYIY